MSRREKEIKGTTKAIDQLTKIASALDGALMSILPEDLTESAEHLVNARIEFLTAVNKFVEKRIMRLEKEKTRIREKAAKAKLRKEKVPVE
jgi:recombinational DNA repair ATPase RecF